MKKSRTPSKSLAERLRAWRKGRGFTQPKAAAHFRVSLRCYQLWESGGAKPRQRSLDDIERNLAA